MNQGSVEMARNFANAAQVLGHLRACDGAFVPRLSERLDIDAYSHKITDKAERFEAWSNNQLIGLVAAYCNNACGKTAFVTNVSVLPSWHGVGIASRLLVSCIATAHEIGFERIELVVDLHNTAATLLYQKHGFTVTDTRDRSQTMHLAV